MLIAAWVGANQKRFDELVQLFLGDNFVLSQRAGWSLAEIAKPQPQLAQKHLTALFKSLEWTGRHNCCKRHVMGLLQSVPIPTRLQGQVLEKAYQFLHQPDEEVAVKCVSMTVLARIALLHPVLAYELRQTILPLAEDESAAIRSRVKSTLKLLSKLP